MKKRQFEKLVKVLTNGGFMSRNRMKKMKKVIPFLTQEQKNKIVRTGIENLSKFEKAYYPLVFKQRIMNDEIMPAGSFIKDVGIDEVLDILLNQVDWDVELVIGKETKLILVTKSVEKVEKMMKLGIVPLEELPKGEILKGLNPKDNPSLPIEERPFTELSYEVSKDKLDNLKDADCIRMVFPTHNKGKQLFAVTFFPDVRNLGISGRSGYKPDVFPAGKEITVEEALKDPNFAVGGYPIAKVLLK